jgi:hypothetical protein
MRQGEPIAAASSTRPEMADDGRMCRGGLWRRARGVRKMCAHRLRRPPFLRPAAVMPLESSSFMSMLKKKKR